MEYEHISGTALEAEAVADKMVIDLSADSDEEDDVDSMIARAVKLQKDGEELQKLQSRVDELLKIEEASQSMYSTTGEKELADSRSIFVGNVDQSATEADLLEHFSEAGIIRRVTILRYKFTKLPKGYAYIEFVDKASVQAAMELSESLFKGRQIFVSSKRTNLPSPGTERVFRSGFRGGRGNSRGFRGSRGRGSSCGASYFKTKPRSHMVYRFTNPY